MIAGVGDLHQGASAFCSPPSTPDLSCKIIVSLHALACTCFDSNSTSASATLLGAGVACSPHFLCGPARRDQLFCQKHS